MELTTEKFSVSSKTRNIFLGLVLAGIVLAALGYFTSDISASRFWTNLMMNNFLFTAIAGVATAWIAIQYVANAGWSASIKRIPEAYGAYLPVGAFIFVVIIIASFIGHDTGLKGIYEWLHPEHVEHDLILQGKAGYLNLPFFAIRLAVYLLLWIFFQRKLRSLSIGEDNGDGLTLKHYNKSWRTSVTFIPLFGLSFSFATWDILMSIEPHWYSTIYGVNVFAGILVTTLSFVVMTIYMLQKIGYMSYVNDNHIHDLGKFIFGFSIFWMYTWTSQFLLIWYANLPEEIPYYLKRMQTGWNSLFFASIIINFATPFLALMRRNSKRQMDYLFAVCVVLLVGRYIDWYLLAMPGMVAKKAGFGFLEIGVFLTFLGMFGLVSARALAKANLVPVNHPYLEESYHHNI